jgi:hypothetical protein
MLSHEPTTQSKHTGNRPQAQHLHVREAVTVLRDLQSNSVAVLDESDQLRQVFIEDSQFIRALAQFLSLQNKRG